MVENLESKIKTGAILLNVGTHEQTKDACGPAALKIVLDSFGRRISEATLRKLAKTDSTGTPPYNLANACESLSHRTFQQTNAKFGDIERFLSAGIPVIVVYKDTHPEDDGHYSVVAGINKTHIILSDPARVEDYQEIRRQDFFRNWWDEDFEDILYKRWFLAVFPNKIPFVMAEGDNYEIGFAIGSACKNDIERMLCAVKFDYKHYTKKSFSTFVDNARKFLPHCRKAFPQYVQELEGMADSAEIDFAELFALNCTEELDWTDSSNPLAEKCTSIVAKTKKGVVLAHNEDYLIYPTNALCIVEAKQKGKPSFLSVGYVGSLAGSSAGINSAGIAMSGNSVSVDDCRFGVLKNFVCRAILDEENIRRAAYRICATQRAAGGNYTLVSSEESAFVETSAQLYSRIPLDELPTFHTNHFVASDMTGTESSVSQSSRERYARLQKIFGRIGGREITMRELKETLADHCDWPIGICRHDYESDKRRKSASTTLASMIMNPAEGTMEVASGNPCRAKYKVYSL